MADIDVVKKGSRAWLWILLVLALALILWFALGRSGPTTTGHIEEGGQPRLAAAVPGTA